MPQSEFGPEFMPVLTDPAVVGAAETANELNMLLQSLGRATTLAAGAKGQAHETIRSELEGRIIEWMISNNIPRTQIEEPAN